MTAGMGLFGHMAQVDFVHVLQFDLETGVAEAVDWPIEGLGMTVRDRAAAAADLVVEPRDSVDN